ncbi:MAG: sigma-70 family RNA polymerase sigma factor [Proteobacteria bacterium]|nr:sigma-70 family RNA polymerase sigma factor [Pseudomonadota bacterium]
MYGIALGMVRNDAEAQDIVQETFLSALRKLHTFRQESPFRGWLFRIASNASLMKLRTRRGRPEVSLEVRRPGFDDDGGHERPSVDWSPIAGQLLENEELGTRLHTAIDELPEKYRLVLQMADFEHRSMREIRRIARALGARREDPPPSRPLVRARVLDDLPRRSTLTMPNDLKNADETAMNCETVVTRLVDYYDGELDSDTSAAVRSHVDECPDCQHFLRTYEATIALAEQSFAVVMPDSVRASLSEALRKELLETG